MTAIPFVLTALLAVAFFLDGLLGPSKSALPYEQTPESRAVFATSEELGAVDPARIVRVVRGDPLHMKLCRDLGRSVHCSALRLSNVGRTYRPGPFPPRNWKPSWGYDVVEVHFCAWEGGAVGLAMIGYYGGQMHEALVEQ